METKKPIHAFLLDGVDIESFGDLLRFFRFTRNLGQQALADRVGMRRQTLAAWEAGTARPRPDSRDYLLKIAQVLELTSLQLDYLLKAATLPIIHPSDLPAEQNEPSTQIQEPRNPYKGLHPFAEQDHQDFFGRSSLTQTIMEWLCSQNAASGRLLTLLGPSGVGKTSLIQAGVIPALRQNGSEPPWIIINPLRPGKDPFGALAQALASFLNRTEEELRHAFADPGYKISHLFEELAGADHAPILLVIDQGEELFTQIENETTRSRFLDTLVELSTAKNGPCWILFAARADFYHQFQNYSAFWQVLQASRQEVTPLEKENLRQVIEGPANLPDVQIVFQSDLVSTLLLETQGRLGGLPLLQFTLDRLFQLRQGNCLTEQAYHDIGGVRGAIGQYAQEIYERASFSERERSLVAQLLMHLVAQDSSMSQHAAPTRRAARLDEFLLVNPDDTKSMNNILTIFIASRLLTTAEIAGEPYVEVAHEAILGEWSFVQSLLLNRSEDMHLVHQLNQAARDWQRHRDRVYRGSQLKAAEEWAKRNSISKQAQAFLHASDRREKRSLWIRGATVFLLLTSFLAAGWFYINRAPTPGYVTTTDEYATGSLRWAIGTAREGDTITFAPDLAGRTFVLTGDLLITEKHLNIYGPSGGITLSNKIHQIHVYTNTSINISNITFMGSQSNITSLLLNDGTLTLTNCIISGNRALPAPGFDDRNADGGGIQNTGTLTLINSQVLGNTVSGKGGGARGGDTAASGGGIANFGKLTLINSTVSGNSASGSVSLGGGISNTGTLTLTNSTVSNNTVSSTPLFGNVGIPSDGGGISSGGTGSVTLMNSTVSGNTASRGGGISNGAGITLMLINSTIADNIATGHGGGLLNYDGEVEIIFCTFYHNKAAAGGGISSGLSQIVMRNSLVAGNVTPLNPDIEAALTSEGYNLIQNTSGLTLFDPDHVHRTDLFGIPFSALHIGPRLQQNGGPTQTLALLSGSPAIDAIPPTDCLIQVKGIAITADQRGVKRPQGSACDIGAYEYQVSSATANRLVMQTPTATANMPAATATEANRRQTCANNYRQATTTNGTMFGFDAQHTGTNPFECILNHENVATLILRWIASAGGDILSPPVVANGIVYVGSDDHYLHALDANTGERLWASPTEGNVLSSPAVANGIVYIGSDDRKLYAFDASTGKQLWASLTGGPAYSGLTVANGTVYISGDKLSAFDASTGKQLWTSPTGKAIISSPAVANGVVYAGSLDHKLYAFDANTGKQFWASSTGDVTVSSPTVANGIVYVGSGDHKLYAFDANTGKQLWASLTGGFVDFFPAVANGIVYVGSDDHKLYAFDANTGKQLWASSTGGNTYLSESAPVVANGIVYIGSGDNKLYAFDASTGKQLWASPTGGAIHSSPVVANGIVYSVSNYKLYAFSLP